MKVMVVLSRVPWPLEKGDKLRAFHFIKGLSKTHECVLFCLSDQRVDARAEEVLRGICSEVFIQRLSRTEICLNLLCGLLNNLPFQVNYFYSTKAAHAFDRYVEKHLPQHIFCQLVRTAEYVRRYTLIPKSMDYMDALSAGMKRMAAHGKWPVSVLMRWEAKRLAAYENVIQNDFQNRYIISGQDREKLPFVNDLRIVPNGISEAFLETRKITAPTHDVLFTGNMAYRPNVATAKFLVREVMPLVWKTHPSTTLCLAGATPTAAVRALANKRITVTGWVADIAATYRSAKVFAAPMSINSGLQNKLLEAMACGLPCITSTLANNALGAVDGESVIIANEAADMARHITTLLDDGTIRERIGAGGRAFVTTHYSWEKAVDALGL